MEWKDAIVKVLQDAKAPMHYTEIAEKIAEGSLRQELTATPANTVVAIITTSLKNDGAESPFSRTSRGYYSLRDAEQQAPALEEGSETETSEVTGLVNAFGMFWERSKILWASQPKILGQQQTASGSVDFCDQRGVYLLHDSQGVVYVGRTTDQSLGRRLYQHTIDRLAGRWTRFSWFGVYPVEPNGTLRTAAALEAIGTDVVIATMEAVLIEGLEPRQNRKRGDDFQAIEFIQLEDPEIESDRNRRLLQELLQELLKRKA
ncbi:HTH domain-containing protein [Candidatus Binatus soli]|jgi:predicted GIY-YIG superfamily endonuclease|uniref:HTH domain-containing protein n=1 Tax=Candidatus Binatus soli TaxID=1953413 RepID=UPI003D12F317